MNNFDKFNLLNELKKCNQDTLFKFGANKEQTYLYIFDYRNGNIELSKTKVHLYSKINNIDELLTKIDLFDESFHLSEYVEINPDATCQGYTNSVISITYDPINNCLNIN